MPENDTLRYAALVIVLPTQVAGTSFTAKSKVYQVYEKYVNEPRGGADMPAWSSALWENDKAE